MLLLRCYEIKCNKMGLASLYSCSGQSHAIPPIRTRGTLGALRDLGPSSFEGDYGLAALVGLYLMCWGGLQ